MSSNESQQTISFVQSINRGFNSANTTTLDPINTLSETNLIIFIVKQGVTGVATITDNMGNTYNQIAFSDVGNSGTWPDETMVFSCLKCSGGTNHIITSTTNNGFSSVFAIEVTAQQDIMIDNISSSAAAQGTTISSGSIFAERNSFVIGLATPGEIATSPTYNWQNGFLNRSEITNTSFWPGTVATKSITEDANIESSVISSLSDEGTSLIIELRL